jgi:hypothetical protein
MISISADQLIAQQLPVLHWNYINVQPSTPMKISVFDPSYRNCTLVPSREELVKTLRTLHYGATDSTQFPSVDWQANTIVLITTNYTSVVPQADAPAPDGKSVNFLLENSAKQANSGVLLFEISGKHPAVQRCHIEINAPGMVPIALVNGNFSYSHSDGAPVP